MDTATMHAPYRTPWLVWPADDPFEEMVSAMIDLHRHRQQHGPVGPWGSMLVVTAGEVIKAMRRGDGPEARAAFPVFADCVAAYEAGWLGTYEPDSPMGRFAEAALDFRRGVAEPHADHPA